MTKSAKIATITAVLLLAGAGVAYAFRKKKPVAAVKKLVGSIIWPDEIGGTQVTTEDGSTVLKQGSKNQYVEQLKDALNDIHKAVAYINGNCSMKWAYFNKLPTSSSGNILTPNDSFDSTTAQVAQFYLNRSEVELDYLNEIREKIAKWKKGNKCIYPLSV